MRFEMKSSLPVLMSALLILAAPFVRADVKPSKIFGDHMVLQRDMPVPVWGKADPGEKVTVSFAGQKKSVVAGGNGKWRLTLKPLKASAKGSEMTISGKNTVKFKDVLVGEVWVCCGQSNMELGVGAIGDLMKLMPEAKKMPIHSFVIKDHITLEPSDKCEGEWRAEPPSSAVAFGFAYFLNKKIDVPIGIIQTSWGSAYIEGWMPIELTKQLPHFKKWMDRVRSDKDIMKAVSLVVEQFEKHGRIDSKYYDDPKKDEAFKKTLAHKPGYTDNANVFARTQPNLLYNAMLHPVIPYAVRGMVWYQGEANAENWKDATQYAESLQLWTKALRKIWKNENFHMLGVMLPGFGKMMGGSPKPKEMEYPGNITWAYMRESQMKLLSLPHTGIANTVDLGDARNIHPHDKKPLCERLALIAARYVYGQKIVAVGPIFSKYKVKGNKLYIKFTHAEGLKTSDGEPPKGFWLTDKEHKEWFPAKARIIGDIVELTSDKVPNPAACRYAFAAKPTLNLVNGAGLPAYPFRTDTWNPYDK